MVKTDPTARLADAALKLLAKTPWRDLALAQVAKAAKVPMTALRPLANGKPALIGLILTKLGDETVARYRPDAESSARDRVFDVAMTWFEISNGRKPAMRSLYDGLKRDPLSLLAARSEIVSAASWLLTLAEADTGPAIALRALALAAAIGRAIPAWLDDGKDMAKTMAQLDGDLRRADSFFGTRKDDGGK
jgi:hypothetical protein